MRTYPMQAVAGPRPSGVTTAMRVMGIINATPDSFWPGSRHYAEEAVAVGREMFEQGAWCVDVGGESTRPGAVTVSPEEELDRIAPVVAGLTAHGRVSIDTRHPQVASAAIGLGASIVNDVSGRMYALAAQLGAGYIGMHSHRVPATTTTEVTDVDIYEEVSEHLRRIAEAARADGVSELWIDPGIGFGKDAVGNLALLRGLPDLCALGIPVLVGASRKRFLGAVTGRDVGDRLAASLAVVAPAWTSGADMIRVHDVAETIDTIRVLEAVWGPSFDRSSTARAAELRLGSHA